MNKKNYEGYTYLSFIKNKQQNRPDKDNIYVVGLSDEEFKHFLIKYLLGDGYYIADPVGPEQANQIILEEILSHYSKEFQKELKKNRKENL